MNVEYNNTKIEQISVNNIIPNRFQPRKNFDADLLNELADSIRQYGIVQPLVLRKLGEKFEIIAGERRYKAACMIGLTTVPAIVMELDDTSSAEIALIENVQRKDLTAIEEAKSYKQILGLGQIKQEELGKKIGKTQSTISNKLRLLNLSEEAQQALLDSKISERHARSLLRLKEEKVQNETLNKIIDSRMTVRETDKYIKDLIENHNVQEQSEEILDFSDDYDKKGDNMNNNENINNIPVADNFGTNEGIPNIPDYDQININSTPSNQPYINDQVVNNLQTNETPRFFNYDNQSANMNFDPSFVQNNNNFVDQNMGYPNYNQNNMMNNYNMPNPMYQPENNPMNNFNNMNNYIPNYDQVMQPNQQPMYNNDPYNMNNMPNPMLNNMNMVQNNFDNMYNPQQQYMPNPQQYQNYEQPQIEQPIIDNNYPNEINNQNEDDPASHTMIMQQDITGAVVVIRNTLMNLQNNGYAIEINEQDLGNLYQIVVNLKK